MYILYNNIQYIINSQMNKRNIHGVSYDTELALSTTCSATLGFLGNFQLVEQLSVYRATSNFLRLISHSHAPATSETSKMCRI